MTTDQTTFNANTPQAVRDTLETLRNSDDRVRVWFGDTETGRAWTEENDVTGRVGRSTGRVKIPLLVHNARSMGGPALLTHCIVRIDRISDGRTLYRHPEFDAGRWHFAPSLDSDDYTIFHNDGFYGREPTRKRAQNLCEFMKGARYAK